MQRPGEMFNYMGVFVGRPNPNRHCPGDGRGLAVAAGVFSQRAGHQSEMAARLGTVPDVVGRALHKLAEEKIIRVERQQIWILDREGLVAMAMVES